MADFKLGVNTPDDVKLGIGQVTAIFCGSTLVWPPSIPNTCPPYYCQTSVDPTGCPDLSYAWYNCPLILSFPLLNVSSSTTFYNTWASCSQMTELANLDVSLGLTFSGSWLDCSSLISFPDLNMGSGTDFTNAWRGCSNLSSFLSTRLGNGVNFTSTWLDCTSLTSLPLLNLGSGTTFSSTWYNCSSLTSFPASNLSNGTTFFNAWRKCFSLSYFPTNMFDTCSATDFLLAWQECALDQTSVDGILISLDLAGQNNGVIHINNGYSAWQPDCSPTPGSSPPSLAGQDAAESLVAKGWAVYLNGWVPPSPPPYYNDTKVNTRGITDLSYAWVNQYGLNTCFPPLDMTSCTNFEGTWNYCASMQSYPFFDFSNGTNFKGTWYSNYALISFRSDYDLSSGTDFTLAWYHCVSLTSFPILNFNSAENMTGSWSGCSSLVTFPALDLSTATIFVDTWRSGVYDSGIVTFEAVDVSGGIDFDSAWMRCYYMTSFASLNFSNGQNFHAAWMECTSLATFPNVTFPVGANFNRAWLNCSSLSTFPANAFDTCTATDYYLAWNNCALSQTSVDDILVSIDASAQINGVVSLDGGTSSTPGTAGLAAKLSLQSKGWTVITN